MNKENCALKLVNEIILFYDARSKKYQITTIKVVESLLGRRHVSALALGHLQVSTCVSEETIECDYSNKLTFIQRDLVDMESVKNVKLCW